MVIYTKYSIGDTVFKYEPQLLAYKVASIHIVLTPKLKSLRYNLTRNAGLGYPSGGDLSDVMEDEIHRDPK